METARQDINNDIMAIRFSNTILLDKPVMHKNVASILRRNGLNPNFQQSPYLIPNAVFNEIYQLGFQLDKNK